MRKSQDARPNKAVLFILTALLLISIPMCPNKLRADDGENNQEKLHEYVPDEGRSIFDKKLLFDILKKTEDESTLRLKNKSSYDLLRFYWENGMLNPYENDRTFFLDDAWLKDSAKNIKLDIEDSLLTVSGRELGKTTLVKRIEGLFRGLTNFRAKKNKYDQKIKIEMPSLNGKQTVLEKELEDKEKELKSLEDADSLIGQEKKLLLTKEIRRMKYDLNEYYLFRIKYSANGKLSREEDGSRLIRVTPYIGFGYKNYEMELQYDLRNKTESGSADFKVLFSGYPSPLTKIGASYEILNEKANIEWFKLFSDSELSLKYSMLIGDNSHRFEAGYTKTLANMLSFTVSASDTLSSGSTPNKFQVKSVFQYKF